MDRSCKGAETLSHASANQNAQLLSSADQLLCDREGASIFPFPRNKEGLYFLYSGEQNKKTNFPWDSTNDGEMEHACSN